jgi:hypothetical protein
VNVVLGKCFFQGTCPAGQVISKVYREDCNTKKSLCIFLGMEDYKQKKTECCYSFQLFSKLHWKCVNFDQNEENYWPFCSHVPSMKISNIIEQHRQ